MSFFLYFALNAFCRHRPCFKPFQRYIFTADLAYTIRAVIDALQRIPDFVDQTTFPVTNSQEVTLGLFIGRTVEKIAEASLLGAAPRNRIVPMFQEAIELIRENFFQMIEISFFHTDPLTLL
jgi:hypothetical protein